MSSPVSSSVLPVVQECLECAVLRGVVGGSVLPAVPYDVEPSSGQDAYGVGVIVASCAGSSVEVLGPGVGPSGIAG